MKRIGVLLENRDTGKQHEVWFDTEEEMEGIWNLWSLKNYKVVKYLNDQQTINFYN